MEITIVILIAVIIVIFIYFKLDNNKLQDKNIVLQQKNQENEGKLQDLLEKNQELSNYMGRFQQLEIINQELKEQNKAFSSQINNLKENLANIETKKQLIEQKSQNLEEEKANWQNEKGELLHKLSEELIRKNKEDQDKFSQNQKEEIKKVTENIFQNFENISNKVSSLNDDLKKSSAEINLTKNALLNPGGAGAAAEITLENILKASGLQQKISFSAVGDYILQSHFSDEENNAKRPDAMIFLPDNNILIIDSKSSKYFIELQVAKEQKNQDLITEISGKIKDRMKIHLEDLKKKSYAKSKLEDLDFKDIFGNNDKPKITTAMFLQTEKMLDIVNEIYPEFPQKCLEEKIYLVGPFSLIHLLNQSKFIINSKKREKNFDNLLIEVKKMIESVGVLLVKSQDVGKNLFKSMKSFNEFGKSFNSRFLPRISKVNDLGIEFNNKNFKNMIEIYPIESSRPKTIEIDDKDPDTIS